MQKMWLWKQAGWVASLALVWSLALPAGADEAAESDEAALRARAEVYWQARVDRTKQVLDFYASPELGGPRRPKDRSEFGNVHYQNFEIRDVRVEGDEGVVVVHTLTEIKLENKLKLSESDRTFTFEEEWHKAEGTWYKKPLELGLSRHYKNHKARKAARKEAEAAAKAQAEAQAQAEAAEMATQ